MSCYVLAYFFYIYMSVSCSLMSCLSVRCSEIAFIFTIGTSRTCNSSTFEMFVRCS
jgi:hypothetical protein